MIENQPERLRFCVKRGWALPEEENWSLKLDWRIVPQGILMLFGLLFALASQSDGVPHKQIARFKVRCGRCRTTNVA